MHLGLPAGSLCAVGIFTPPFYPSLFFTLRKKLTASIYDIIWKHSSIVSCSILVEDVFVAFLENSFSSCASSWMHECFKAWATLLKGQKNCSLLNVTVSAEDPVADLSFWKLYFKPTAI